MNVRCRDDFIPSPVPRITTNLTRIDTYCIDCFRELSAITLAGCRLPTCLGSLTFRTQELEVELQYRITMPAVAAEKCGNYHRLLQWVSEEGMTYPLSIQSSLLAYRRGYTTEKSRCM